MDSRPGSGARRKEIEDGERIVVDLRDFAERLNGTDPATYEAALLEAEATLEEARREAAAIIAAAEHRATTLRSEARRELAAAHDRADSIKAEAHKVLGRAHRKAQRLVEEAKLDAALVRGDAEAAREELAAQAPPEETEPEVDVAEEQDSVVAGPWVDEGDGWGRASMYQRRGRRLPRIGRDGGDDLGEMLGRLRRSSRDDDAS